MSYQVTLGLAILGLLIFVAGMVVLTVKLCRWHAPDDDDEQWIGQ